MKSLVYQCDAQGILSRASTAAHVERLCHVVREAAEREAGVDLVVLPELSTIEYSDAAFALLPTLAEGLDGPSVGAFAALARDINATVVFGMPRVDEAGRYTISQVAIDAQGAVIGHFDKVHVAQFGASAEKAWFDRGDHSLVFEVEGFRVGVVICYDMRFPVFIHDLVRAHDLDVVLHPVAFAQDGSWPSWPAFATTRALENQVYWLSVNRSGPGWGHSIVCPPWVDDTVSAIEFGTDETLRTVQIERDAIDASRRTYPFREDALGDYATVVSTP